MTGHAVLWAGPLLIAGMLLIPAAQAASFDCARAAQADERAVCADPGLSALDSEMGGLWFAYHELPLLMGASGARQDEAEAFLQERAACGDDRDCLDEAYRTRIATLKDRLRQDIAAVASSQAAPAELPSPVAAIDYAEQCRSLGGRFDPDDRPSVLAGDLDRDGSLDYLLDTAALECAGAATAFCANSGCRIDLALSSAGFRPVTTTGGAPSLAQQADGLEASIWVSDEQCPDLPADRTCWLRYVWADGKLQQSHETRPRSD
ncbi:lysozyme inhibitor LprI family protein [Geminicoccus flavidas]|uniref:lysozyme inhibitor LprI family protein n=1 Tax=Geminicoccus flavidas TaxID=2506407 RepID=UPI00190FAA52|nr:hypothetical protein [Geminicoccus flavidas]